VQVDPAPIVEEKKVVKKIKTQSKARPTDEPSEKLKEGEDVTPKKAMPEWQAKHAYNLLDMPPPSELLRKQNTINEPVRTGFNQGFLPINIKDNVEHGRYEQGPKIVVTSEKVYISQNSTVRSSQQSQMGKTRNNSVKPVSREASVKPADAAATDGDKPQDPQETQDKVKQVIHETIMNQETSLRHLFYLEYKRAF